MRGPWPDFAPETIAPFAVGARTREAVVGNYEGKSERVLVDARVRSEGEKLYFDSERLGLSSEMLFVSKTGFVVRDSGDELSVTFGADGAVDAMHFGDITLVHQKP